MGLNDTSQTVIPGSSSLTMTLLLQKSPWVRVANLESSVTTSCSLILELNWVLRNVLIRRMRSEGAGFSAANILSASLRHFFGRAVGLLIYQREMMLIMLGGTVPETTVTGHFINGHFITGHFITDILSRGHFITRTLYHADSLSRGQFTPRTLEN